MAIVVKHDVSPLYSGFGAMLAGQAAGAWEAQERFDKVLLERLRLAQERRRAEQSFMIALLDHALKREQLEREFQMDVARNFVPAPMLPFLFGGGAAPPQLEGFRRDSQPKLRRRARVDQFDWGGLLPSGLFSR